MSENHCTTPDAGAPASSRLTTLIAATNRLSEAILDALDGQEGCFQVQQPAMINIQEDDLRTCRVLPHAWATFRVCVLCEVPFSG